MSPGLETADRMIWSLARQCRADDVAILGLATPVAAAATLLAKAVLVPEMTVIIAGAVDPEPHDIAAAMLDVGVTAESAAGTLLHLEMLDAIGRGAITLQFVSPAEVDARGRLNTSRVTGRDGRARRLAGPLALPDVAVLVGRLVAYRCDHSRRFLVPRVQFVTGAGGEIDRHRVGGGVTTVLTDRAEIALDPAGGAATVRELAAGVSFDRVREDCGFELTATGVPPRSPAMPAEARRLLDGVIDPHRVRLLEVREGRAEALTRLSELARERRVSSAG